MNKIILSGNLVNESELQTTKNRVCIAKNKIAIKDESADKKFCDTYFINLKAFGKNANPMVQYKKGDLIKIEGKLVVKSFKGTNGEWVNITEVIVFNSELLYSSKKSKQDFTNVTDDEDIPF